MGRLSGGRRALLGLALVVVLGVTACASSPQPSPRDVRWRQDVDYLARELPAVRAGRFGPVSPSAWRAAAARLTAAVPRLTDGQIEVRMAQLVTLLRDDETTVRIPARPVLPVRFRQIDGAVYVVAVARAERRLLGGRLLAVDGHPIGQVLARLGTVIDAEDPQLRGDTEIEALAALGWLHPLGLTASANAAVLTVRTRAGVAERVRFAGADSVDQNLAQLPLPLYGQDATKPYWLRVLPGQHAVYLKYNQCLADNGFQRLAGQALALLHAHPDYRLIVDLRNNPGGDSTPFESLIAGITGNHRLTARVVGLVNDLTDSSATVDAQSLENAGVVVIGQPPADPLDTWGNEQTFRLPRSGLVIQYTTSVINPSPMPWGMPDVAVAPTVAQVLAGDDPVLTAALRYPA